MYTFEGDYGEKVKTSPIPESYAALVEEKTLEMIEKVADADDEIAELFLMEEIPDSDTLKAAI